MIWKLIANNWYSILINGQIHGLFYSPRGVKYGDPLFPTLFIITAKVLTRALNHHFDNTDFKNFGMPKWSEKLNYLIQADDIIIFYAAKKKKIALIINILKSCENQSGQEINKDKSYFYMMRNVGEALIKEMKEATGFVRCNFPIMYLGFPINHGKMKKSHFDEVFKKIQNKTQVWKGKFLSFDGKTVLINHVLQSVHVHLLLILVPPKCVIKDIHRIFVFFLQFQRRLQGKALDSSDDICLSKEEGGLDLRFLFDVSKVVFTKLWKNFRTKNTLWSNFRWNKYCKRYRPQVIEWRGGSQVWKMMLMTRKSFDQEIWWVPKCGDVSL